MIVNLPFQGSWVRAGDRQPRGMRGMRLRLWIHTLDGELPLELASAEVRSVKGRWYRLLFTAMPPLARERL